MNERRLISIALSSRLSVIILQFISNIFIPDHDAKVFQYLRTKSEENYVSAFLNYFLSGFIRWDAEYFMHISKYGYTYENSLAFFPLYPYLVRVLTEVLIFFIPIFKLDTALLLVFILCNVIFFILSVKVLYKLTLLFFDPCIAYKTAVLFCFNPASIFFSAPYTECMFSYLTFQSMYFSFLLIQKYTKQNSSFSWGDIKVIIFVSLSTLVRSNGLLNIGFLVYAILCIFYSFFPNNKNKLLYLIKYFCIVFTTCAMCSLPFILYQIYCYKHFCTDYTSHLPIEIVNFGSEKGFVLPGQFTKFNQSWCYKNIPLAYSYVQDHYWNVGLLKYYELKQIPNFLLATPCLYIMIKNCILHLKTNVEQLMNIFNLNEITRKEKFQGNFYKLPLTVFVIHALFLSIFCTLCIHVQVSTRMICSATPLFYWYSTYYCINNKESLIKFYFGSYVIIGIVMFCNFLPWT